MDPKGRIKAVLAALGIRVGAQWDDPWWRRGAILRRYGVDLVLDVGANTGQYARRLRTRSGYEGRIVSFEPVTEAYEQLERSASRDPRWECRKLALGDRDGEAEIVLGGSTDVSSFLAFREWPLAAVTTARAAGAEPVRVARLDSLDLVSHGRGTMLKLDVQGYEPQVLAGAARTLESVDVLECELAFEHLYEGQPSFREMVDLVEESGFAPLSVETGNFNPATASLTYVDVVFARRRDGQPHGTDSSHATPA